MQRCLTFGIELLAFRTTQHKLLLHSTVRTWDRAMVSMLTERGVHILPLYT